MTNYAAISDMVQSSSLRNRIVACVAGENISNPEGWTASNIWNICATIGDTEWTYGVDNYNVNQNPDIGARNDVISDQAILSAVQAVVAQA